MHARVLAVVHRRQLTSARGVYSFSIPEKHTAFLFLGDKYNIAVFYAGYDARIARREFATEEQCESWYRPLVLANAIVHHFEDDLGVMLEPQEQE